MKKKSFSKIILAVLLCMCAVFALAACGDIFPPYSFKNPAPSDYDWRDIDYPDKVNLDGVINESVWKDLTPTVVKNDTGLVTLSTKLYLGEEGMFFAMECNDPLIYYTEERTVYNNTSVELYISKDNGALNKNTVQFRFGVNGYTEQWIGVATDNEYAWTRAFVRCMSRIKINGELNTSENDGYAIEAYIPYYEIGIDASEGKPEKVYVYSAFNRASNTNGKDTRLGWYGQPGDINAPASYYPFNDKGYMGGESKDSPIGDFGGYSKTSGWDLNGVFDEENKSVKTIAGGEQIIYFKNVNTNIYAVSATVKRDRAINDNYPKAGILAAQNESGMAVSMFDVVQTYTKDLFGVRRPAGGEWNWPGGNSDGMSRYNGSIDYVKGAKITVARYNDMFYYFVNGQFMFEIKNAMFGENASVAGLITFGCAVEFSEFESTTNTDEVETLIASVKQNDETNGWQWLGDFEPDGDKAVTLKPDSANVGGTDNNENGQRYIKKTGVTLTGDFELSYNVADLTFSKTLPDWMNPYITTRLYRTDGSVQDVFMLHAKTEKKFSVNLGGSSSFYSDDLDGTDFTESHKVTIVRKINESNAMFKLYFDGTEIGSYNSSYTGDYEFGFSSNYTAGKITGIYTGNARSYNVTETHNEGGTVTLDKTSAALGETVTATIAPAEGYLLSAVTVNGKDMYNRVNKGKLEFSVGEETELHVTFEKNTAEKRTLNGKVTLDSAGGGALSDVTVTVNDALQTYTPTVNGDGTFSIELYEGNYTVTAQHSLAHYAAYEEHITLNNSTDTLLITLGIADPTVNGKMENKDFYYTDDRKLSINGKDGRLDYYLYFGTDGIYMMFDVTASSEPVTNKNDDGSIKGDSDNVEIAIQAGDLTGGRAKDRNFHILIWSALTGQGYYDSINDNCGRYGNESFIKQFMVQGFNKNDNGYRMELKFDYAMFGLSEKPETVAVAPAYKHRGEWKKADANFDVPLTYVIYDKDGIVAKTADSRTITLDGSVADWEGARKLNITGTGNCEGKSVDFYGLLKEDGLYLAADAHHKIFTFGQSDWWRNTNFEFFLGGGNKQLFVYATGADTFGKSQEYMQVAASVSGDAESGYHTVIEVFIPRANLEEGMVEYNVIRAGVAWKTIGDKINNGEGSGGNEDEYWVPKGTWTNNADKAYITVDGIYKRK